MGDHFTCAQFINAIPGSAGIITTIAERVGCTWRTAKRYIDKYPTVRAAYEDEREKGLDQAESVLLQNILLAAKLQKEIDRPVDVSDAKWLLDRRGRERGYVTRQEVTGAEGERLIPEPIGVAELVRELNRLFDAARAREARATDRAESLPTLE